VNEEIIKSQDEFLMPEPIVKQKTPPKLQLSLDNFIKFTKQLKNNSFGFDEKNDFLAPMPMKNTSVEQPKHVLQLN